MSSAPPRVGLLEAVRLHPLFALLPVVVLVAIAVGLGLSRSAQYSATAELSVGHGYVDSPSGIPGVIEATQSLAAVYARAVRAQPVSIATARQLDRQGLKADATLSATPIPSSPLIKVTAKSTSSRTAIAAANAAGVALARYANQQSQTGGSSTSALKAYERAALNYQRALNVRTRAAAVSARTRSRAATVGQNRAEAAAETARLQRDTLEILYQNTLQGLTAGPSVSTFALAGDATSDRTQILEILVLAALVAGLALGAVLALLRAQRTLARRWLEARPAAR
jgi:hypothetical protein